MARSTPFQRNQPSPNHSPCPSIPQKALDFSKNSRTGSGPLPSAVPAITLSPRGIGCAGYATSHQLAPGGGGREETCGRRLHLRTHPKLASPPCQQFLDHNVWDSYGWTTLWTGRGRAATGRARSIGVFRWICPKIRWNGRPRGVVSILRRSGRLSGADAVLCMGR